MGMGWIGTSWTLPPWICNYYYCYMSQNMTSNSTELCIVLRIFFVNVFCDSKKSKTIKYSYQILL